MQFDCPACDCSKKHQFLYAKNSCAIFKCSGCGLGRAQYKEFAASDYYSADYFSGGRADGYADYRGAEAVLRREFSHSLNFIRAYKASGRLLEIGCAYGFFLQEAAASFEVAGIEIAEEPAPYCRERGLRVLTGVADERNLLCWA